MAVKGGNPINTRGLVFTFDPLSSRGYNVEPTDNIMTYPIPPFNWGISHYLSSAGTITASIDDDGTYFLEMNDIVRASGSPDYPRVGTSNFSPVINTGTKFSISYEARSVDGGNILFSIYSTGSTKNTFTGPSLPTSWSRVEHSNNVNNTFQLTQPYLRFGGDSERIDVRKIQVELKDHTTPWTATSRSLYTDVVYDLSGNNYSINAVSASYDTGSVMYFSGSHYCRINSLNVGNPITITAWVNPDRVTGDQVIISPNSNGSDNWFTLTGTSLSVFYTETADVNNGAIVGPAAQITVNKWNHVAMTITGSSAALYVNGQPSTSTTAAYTIGDWSGNWDIGRRAGIADKYFYGHIANLLMYDRALSAAEILENYNNTKGRFL